MIDSRSVGVFAVAILQLLDAGPTLAQGPAGTSSALAAAFSALKARE